MKVEKKKNRRNKSYNPKFIKDNDLLLYKLESPGVKIKNL